MVPFPQLHRAGSAATFVLMALLTWRLRLVAAGEQVAADIEGDPQLTMTSSYTM